MAWEYLISDVLDLRFAIIKHYIKTKDRHIVDLNCLAARGVFYFTDWKSYRGNDLIGDYFPSIGEFVVMHDEDFIKTVDRVDVLLALGVGGGKHPMESKTDIGCVIWLIEHKKPEYIAIDMVQEWTKSLKPIKEVAKNYVIHEIDYCCRDLDYWTNKRKLLVMERK